MSSKCLSLRFLAVLFACSVAAMFSRVPVGDAQPNKGKLTSRPLPVVPAVERIAQGEEIRTKTGERRRVQTAEGAVLYLNENTTLSLKEPGLARLAAGEIYVQSPITERKEVPWGFVVDVAGRPVLGNAAGFAVRAEKKGPAVLVTRGTVTVQGTKPDIRAGQQLAAGAESATPAPRGSHALGWLRELMCAGDAALLPANPQAGGALVAIDPNGQEAKLGLRHFHVDVHIEDGFARTTIDQTYFNHHSEQLEGTFYFPLPADASLSRLCMYVNGQLMEGGMAERDHARTVYETIRYARRDPALLEWVDGSTFKMRVFPLEPRQEKRIVLSYSQRLDSLYGKLTYRFPAGHTLQKVDNWLFHARVKDGVGWTWDCPSHKLTASAEKRDLHLSASAANAATNRDVVLSLVNPRVDPDDDTAQFATVEHEGAKYLLTRYRPRLTGKATAQRRDWVFLAETSGDRDPLLARVQIEVLRHLLQYAGPDDTFALLAAGTRVQALAKEPLPLTPENVQAAIAFLESAHLIGALDLSQTLTEAAAFLKKGTDAHLVHLGSGVAAMGERRNDMLARLLPEGSRYVGIGVGRKWNRGLMKLAAERTGGYFTQINPDEPIAWRAFELISTINTPRLMDIEVLDQDGKAKFLAFNEAIAQGEEIAAVTRIVGDAASVAPGKATQAASPTLPKAVVIRGTLEGKKFERVLRVTNATPQAAYLPRTWAKLEIDRLLADDAVKHKDTIIALSKAMYVISPFTSLLVLENEDQYIQYRVDRGRKDHWALFPLPERIPVVIEPDPDAVEAKAGKLPARKVLQTIATRARQEELRAKNGMAKGDLDRVSFSRMRARPVGDLAPAGGDDFGVDIALGAPVLFQRHASLQMTPDPAIGGSAPAKMSPGGAGPLGLQIAKSAQRRLVQMEAGVADLPPAPPIIDAFGRPAPIGLPAGGSEPFERIMGVTLLPAPNDPMAPRNDPMGLPITGSFYGRSGATRQHASAKPNLLPLAWYAWKAPGAKPQAEDVFLDLVGQMTAMPQRGPIYERPSHEPPDETFYNLVAYAPGLGNSEADVLAVLDAEAISGAWNRPGKIDPAARKLIDAARPAGWQTLTMPASDREPALTIHFDGAGRFVYDRVLANGLRERVVADGTTLMHLYPQLALAARRDVHRFQRSELASAVPWYLPPVDELALGCNVLATGARTVAIVPRPSPSFKDGDVNYVMHLEFADDGRLAGRNVVKMPTGNTVYRVALSADGTATLFDGKGKELHVQKGKLVPAKPPELTADTKDLLVLALPYRSSAHVRKTLKMDKRGVPDLTLKEALPLFASYVAEGNSEAAMEIFRQVFHAREQRQLGFYVLLASCGINLDSDHGNVMGEHIEHPLAQYLALHTSPVLRKHASQWAVGSGSWQDGFLAHLAVSHALLQRWQNPKLLKGEAGRIDAVRADGEVRRAVDYLQKNRDMLLGWALLCAMQERAGDSADVHARLADWWPAFASQPGLRFAAGYETARSLARAGRKDEAAKRFTALYEAAIKDGALPAIDDDFRRALLAGDAWGNLLRQTAKLLVEQKRRPALLAIARQCWEVNDAPLAGELLAMSLDGIGDADERAAMTLAAFDFLRDTRQLPEADRLLQGLLSDPKVARHALLWRLASDLAKQRDMEARAVECLEKALDIEAERFVGRIDNPSYSDVIDLEAVRTDHRALLTHYQGLADAMVALKLAPPADFRSRVIRAADRWRGIDNDPTAACDAAAGVLKRLGDRELAWDYLTTPVALHPNESGPWWSLAATLGKQGELTLADRAYRAASSAEPTDPQILWDRAQNLKQMGKHPDAQQLVRQIADGTWQPRFQGLQAQARHTLKSK